MKLPPRTRPRRVSARPGGSRRWGRESKAFARGKTCWLRLPGCTIQATGVDHFFPVMTHPHLEWVVENWRPACLHCNCARRHTPVHDLPRLRAKMERDPKYRKRRPPNALGFFG